jgi:hypothetical protein
MVALECTSALVGTYKGKGKGNTETCRDEYRGRIRGIVVLMLNLGAA